MQDVGLREDVAHRLPLEKSRHVSRWDLKRTIRRPELRHIVPLADTTIYEMEQRGEFPRRFDLNPRCVVWDLDEVQAWVEERRRASDAETSTRARGPDVHQQRSRPVKARDQE